MIGFLSEETKTYLADVYDHIRCVFDGPILILAGTDNSGYSFVLLSLDVQDSTTRELIQFTFNVRSIPCSRLLV